MRTQLKSFDFLLFLAVIILSVFGIIAIGSAIHVNIEGAYGEYSRQKIWLVMGIILLLGSAFINYHFICKFYILIYIFCILLLIAALFYNKFIGHQTVARWIYIGPIGIQPSEFAKIFMIIYLSSFINLKNQKINDLPVLFLLSSTIAIPIFLIMLQPSLSVSLVIVAISISILFVGKINRKYILTAFAVTVPVSLIFYIDLIRTDHIFVDKVLAKYQITRILTALGLNPNPDSLYQQSQSILAIGSGQSSGKGLYQGLLTQNNSLPESHNDLIFAVIGEEFGFIGCSVVIFVMMFIIIKCIITAYKAPDLLGKLLCIGVASLLAFQTFVNVSVVTGLLPVTGMPFPFLSYGGSSMWICMIAIGLVINVGMRKTKSIFKG